MQLLAFLPVLCALVPHIYARDHKHYDASHLLRTRNTIQETALADSYDFVIAGGGVAGLVLANRLSEDANTTVLVIEAGGTGDDVASSINVPVNCYYDSLLNTASDWAYQTVAQPDAGGKPLAWPRGKVLGGSSAINGLYLIRPSQIEVDLWSSMIASESGDNVSAGAWNWDNMFAAMKKTETFTPPSASIQSEGDIQYNTSSHGTTGPLQYSYPGYMYPAVGNWSSTLSAVGVPPSPDSAGGQAWGSYVATSSINPANWTRSYARSAYLDPLPPRANLAVLTGNTVTRLIFSGTSAGGGNLTATQVEYASGASAALKTVNVGKEVILAGGAVGSPQILMLSGVGPQGVLTLAGVNATLVLPGVGHHLQDHLATEVVWSTSGATDATTYASQYTATPSTSSAFLSFVNSATAYVNISTLLGADAVAAFQENITSFLPTALSTGLVPSTDATVIAGYEAIYNATANTVLTSPVGQVELLLALTGTASGAESVAVQVALQHPYSQGQIYIDSANPFDYPAINPQYLSHFADTILIREGLKLARKIGQTAPLSHALGAEVSPGTSVNTDAEWDAFIAGSVATEYHPSGTCAMLPLSQGGVVDSNLKVYGLANVRVVDSSVFPIEFAAHLQAPTYALAEQAADIIRAQYNNGSLPWQPAPSATSSSSSTPTASQSTTATPGSSSNSATPLRPWAIGGVLVALMVASQAYLV